MDTSFLVDFVEVDLCSACGMRTSVASRRRVARNEQMRKQMAKALMSRPRPRPKPVTAAAQPATPAADPVLHGDAALLQAIRGVLSDMSLAELQATAQANADQIAAATGELERLLKTQHLIQQLIEEKKKP